jgi:hypothetical protein
MDTPNLPAEDTGRLPVPPRQCDRRQSIWSVPLESALTAFLNNRDAVGRFLSLTGGSILYCLSALSIVYGITQIIGPPLAKSSALADILPCVAVLNVYELALLAVLVLIVVCRHVTDDAISLVILVGLFLVASGMTLGVVAPSGLNICLAIGFASVILGLGKLYVLRRFVSLRIGVLSAFGLTLILLWNFLASSLMARPIMARTATEELRRSQWLLSWLVVLVGAAGIFIEAASRKYARDGEQDRRPPFLHTRAMAWVFALVLLAAAGFHQYGVAYMFAIDHVYGDFIPLIAVMSLLLLELIRSLAKQYENLEVMIACVPLGLTVFAVPNKMTVIPASIGIEAISYPPVVLGLTGLALLWMGFRRRSGWLGLVAIAYALGVLLTMSRSHEFNLRLFGGGLIVVLLTIGAILRNVHLCFAGVIAATVGLGTTEILAVFSKAHDLTTVGAILGIGALGIMAVTFAFGRRTPAAYVLLGTLSAMACIFDYLPKSLQWVDLAVLVVIGSLFAALLWRTRNVAPALVLWIPVFPRAYLLMARMSSWNFVVLSFLLLLLGALMSLFFKQKLLPERPLPTEPPKP